MTIYEKLNENAEKNQKISLNMLLLRRQIVAQWCWRRRRKLRWTCRRWKNVTDCTFLRFECHYLYYRKLTFEKNNWSRGVEFQFSWNVIVHVFYDEWIFERTRFICAHWTYHIFNSFFQWRSQRFWFLKFNWFIRLLKFEFKFDFNCLISFNFISSEKDRNLYFLIEKRNISIDWNSSRLLLLVWIEQFSGEKIKRRRWKLVDLE